MITLSRGYITRTLHLILRKRNLEWGKNGLPYLKVVDIINHLPSSLQEFSIWRCAFNEVDFDTLDPNVGRGDGTVTCMRALGNVIDSKNHMNQISLKTLE